MKDTYFLTTAIDYTNAAPHIGHAYEKTLTDVLARYARLRGEKVYFLTGVDQHGQKVQQSAEKEGVAPREFAERNTELFRDFYRKLDVAYDGWAATTDPRHVRVVQRVLQSLFDNGQIYKARYEGHYSVRQEQFLTDKERDAETGEFGPEWGEVVYLEEENYYFKLSEHRDWLLGFLEQHESFISPRFRAADVVNAAQKISADLCISRPKERLAWGIELPFDANYVTYVWFDALLNYASFAGFYDDVSELPPRSGLPELSRVWPPDVQVIGKDILVPAHGIYWPAMLHAMGCTDDQMPRLLVHGWWNVAGAKISKSTGNVVDPDALADRFGAETLRYYLMREIVTGQDADFSEDRLLSIYESELANGVGNLLNRTLNMAGRYRAGRLAAAAGDPELPELGQLRKVHAATITTYGDAMNDSQPRAALESLRELTAAGNALVEAAAPWKLAKLTAVPAAQSRLDAVLTALAETCRTLALLLAPVLPEASVKMLTQLNYTPPSGGDGLALAAAWGSLGEGHVVGEPSPVFPRLEKVAG